MVLMRKNVEVDALGHFLVSMEPTVGKELTRTLTMLPRPEPSSPRSQIAKVTV
jgi:hypothetical protein